MAEHDHITKTDTLGCPARGTTMACDQELCPNWAGGGGCPCAVMPPSWSHWTGSRGMPSMAQKYDDLVLTREPR